MRHKNIARFNLKSWISLLMLFIIAVLSSLTIHGCVFRQQNNELKTLKIGISNWPGFDVVLYAQETGLFEKQGLEVELVRFDNALDAARAMLRGSLDAAFESLWEVTQVDPGNDKPTFVMVTNISAGSDGIVTQPQIKSVKDLSGKKVGAKLGTVNHLILLEALKSHQIKPTDVQIEDISNELAVQRMGDKNLDGAVIWEPLLSDTAKKINGNIVYTTKDLDSIVIDGLASRASFVDTHKDELTRFIAAWFDLMQAVDTKPNEVFEIVSQQLGQTPESFASDYSGLKKGDIAMNQRMFEPQGRLTQAIKQIVQWLHEDTRHGRTIREDVEINAEPVKAAIEQWKSQT